MDLNNKKKWKKSHIAEFERAMIAPGQNETSLKKKKKKKERKMPQY